LKNTLKPRKASEMERTNAFTMEENHKLRELADNCAKPWNEINFERRQAYIHYRRFE